jgi:tetratricopeptide (TPR) repeat protein
MTASNQALSADTRTMFDEALRHYRAGKFNDAEKIYRQILAIDPRHADSLHLLGMINHQKGQLDTAVAFLLEAIELRKDVALYHNNLANVLKDQRKFKDAERHYTQAIALKPDFAEAHYNLGCSLQDQKQFAAAISHFEQAIHLRPSLTLAYVNLGNALKAQGRSEDAIAQYERALTVDPKSGDAYYNLATALKDHGRFQDAIAHYQNALGVRPDHSPTHNNLGVLLREQGDLTSALQHFQRATSLRSDHAEAHVNEAMLLLLFGEFAQGWRKYEWRNRVKGSRPPVSTKPLWDGSNLSGKTILLCGEQGLGDCLQFVRYAPLVKSRGGRVFLMCPAALARLFEGIESIDRVSPEGTPPPEHDCYLPLMSLPMIFDTTLESIPHSPYLCPPKDEVEKWAKRMSEVKGLKVGLVWAGNSRPDHPTAHAVDLRRSTRLEQFAPLAAIPGVTFFSLQKGDPARQLETFLAFKVIDYMNEVDDFADTAALVANLDLVIGVDTSVIHLAGAMGKRVLVLSRFDGCWRWLLERDDSPWYPSMRLFRQTSIGDWASVIENIRNALRSMTELCAESSSDL